jgi:segregation and condensation protein B
VPENLKNIVEAALLAAGGPLSLDSLQALFDEIECPGKKELRAALDALIEDYDGRGIEVVEVSSGWRIQVGKACSPWVSRLWDEKPARYSRALMETLALIAYRQPITRGEIEDIRGVSVSTNIVKTLMEREWVRVVGQRDVPGRPSLYGTTREFLDYFGLKSLDELPTLAELRDLDEINRELDLEDPEAAAQAQADGDVGEDPASDEADDVKPTEAKGTEPVADSDPATADPMDEDERTTEQSAVDPTLVSAAEIDPVESAEDDGKKGL